MGRYREVRGIIEWHVTCKETIVREGLLGQAELGWSTIGAAELSGRLACQAREGMIGVEGDIRGRILEETWLGLLKVQAAARRERSRIEELQGWGEGNPPTSAAEQAQIAEYAVPVSDSPQFLGPQPVAAAEQLDLSEYAVPISEGARLLELFRPTN